MNFDPDHLASIFRELNDVELMARCSSGNLDEQAQKLADAELAARGLRLSDAIIPEVNVPDDDLVTVARYLNPVDAHIVRACLEAAGIPAALADENFTQMFTLVAAAAGGVRIRVPGGRADEAAEVIRAFNRGELTLRDDESREE